MRTLSLVRCIATTAHALRLVLEDRLREFDVSPAQFGILSALRDYGQPLSGRALARRLDLRAQTIAAMLGPLEARKLISRRPSASHGRIVEISLTAAGGNLHRRCLARVRAVERAMVKGLDRSEVDLCIDLLDRVRTGLGRGPSR